MFHIIIVHFFYLDHIILHLEPTGELPLIPGSVPAKYCALIVMHLNDCQNYKRYKLLFILVTILILIHTYISVVMI